MADTAYPGADLGLLLDDLLRRVAGTRSAVMLSADGLLMARSATLGQDQAEQLSAMASALQSLARTAGRHIGGGGVRQTVVELEQAYLVVTAAGRGACLAVVSGADVDLGVLGYEANLLVRRVGTELEADPRAGRAATAELFAAEHAARLGG